MTEEREVDLVVIGAGQASVPLVRALAKQGMSAVLVEQSALGGSCINFGCTPTKAALASARQAALSREQGLGVAAANVRVDYCAVIDRAVAFARNGREHLDSLFADGCNPQLVRGHGRLRGRAGDRLRVAVDDGPVFVARNVVLDTGTRSKLPSFMGIEAVPVITAETWLDLPTLPEHLLMIGSGSVGLEMAQFYRRMGAAVTVIERADEIAAAEDVEVGTLLRHALADEGVTFRTGVTVDRIASEGGGIQATVAGESLRFSHVFVASGRSPALADLGLDSVGLSPGRDGALAVDECLRTRVPGLFAAGDIRGGLRFTQTAWDDHRVILSALGGGSPHTTRRTVPYAFFTDPEVGRVGMSEKDARRAAVPHHVHLQPYASIARAREDGRERGLIKLVLDAARVRLLGAAIVGEGAGELIHLLALVMQLDQPLSAIVEGVYAHPTLAEGLQSAVAAAVQGAA